MKIHPSAQIHASAIISEEAEIAENVVIGPFSIIQGKVKIGAGSTVEGHVSIGSRYGVVEIGKENHFYPGAAIGGPPQDITYKNEPTRLVIGDHNTFREFSTANIGTSKSKLTTQIGSHCYFMAYTHVGHDCEVGNYVIMANDSHLGGHTYIEDHVTIGGVCAFSQFVRVGKNSFIAGGSEVNKDILPFSRAEGRWAVVRATNKIGLQRKGFAKEEIEAIHKCIRIVIMGSATMAEAFSRIEKEVTPGPHVDYLVNFIKSSKRGIAK